MVCSMARTANPYRPGFNQAPQRLVGREGVLAAAREAIEVAALDGRTPRPLGLVGPRGVGKTVLLGEIAGMAAEAFAWPSVHVEAIPGQPFAPAVTERLEHATHLLRRTSPPERPGDRTRVTGGKVSAAGFGVGAEVTLAHQEAPEGSRPLEAALTAAMREAVRHDAGLLLTLDEMHEARREDVAVVAACLQRHVPDHWPLVVALAGLPSLRDPRRSVTYLERAEWHELGLLSREEAVTALREPAADAGRPMSAAAAQLLAEASGGYPFAVQVEGHYAWRASTGSSTITVAHAGAAVERAEEEFSGMYQRRWAELPGREQEYVAAVAALEPEQRATNAEVARHLDRVPSAVTYLRSRLIRRGLLYPDGPQLRFYVPGMGRWVRAQGLPPPRA